MGVLQGHVRTHGNGNVHTYVYIRSSDDYPTVLQMVRWNTHVLKGVPRTLRGDRAFMLAAVAIDGQALQYASDELRSDRELMVAACEQSFHALPYIGCDFLCCASVVNPQLPNWKSTPGTTWTKSDYDILTAAARFDVKSLQNALKNLQANELLVLCGDKGQRVPVLLRFNSN